MEIAGLCLPLKPQKERRLHDVYINVVGNCFLEMRLTTKSRYSRREARASTDFCGDQRFHVQIVSASKSQLVLVK